VTEQAISELTFCKENARELKSSGKYFKHNKVCLFSKFADVSSTGYGSFMESSSFSVDRQNDS
jgi:hypothetical protein